MTLSPEARREYDKQRRPAYSVRASVLRKSPARKLVAQAATARWKEKPENWVKVLVANAKFRATKFGVEFTITASDVALVGECPVLGIALSAGGNTKADRDSSPSLDRFDNALGYVPGNVRIISWRANRLKSDATTAELERLLAYSRGEV